MDEIKDLLDAEEKKTAGSGPQLIEHYYGDLVRKLFMFAAIVMIVGLPFVYQNIPMPFILSLGGIVVLGIFAGLTNPKQVWVMALNFFIALACSIIFEIFAVRAFADQVDFFFIINQLLALVFLFALYYSTKSLRGKLI